MRLTHVSHSLTLMHVNAALTHIRTHTYYSIVLRCPYLLSCFNE